MSIAQSLLPEFDQETASTRKVLALVPDSKFDWKAGPKFQSIGWNANHLAEILDWGTAALTAETFDVAPPGGPAYQSPKLTSTKAVLDLFDQNLKAARAALAKMSDADFLKNWSLLKAGQPMMTMPRIAVVRSFVLNHQIHHRGILLVYLRLNDIKVPGMYGPGPDDA